MKRRLQIIALALVAALFSAGCGGCITASEIYPPEVTLLDPVNVTDSSATLIGHFDYYGSFQYSIWEWGVCYGVRSTIDFTDPSLYNAPLYLDVPSQADGQRCVKSGDVGDRQDWENWEVNRPRVLESWGVESIDLLPDTEYAYRLYYRYDEVIEGSFFFLPNRYLKDVQGGTYFGYFRTSPATAGASAPSSAPPSATATPSATAGPPAGSGAGTVLIDRPERLEVTQGGSTLAFVGIVLPEGAGGTAMLDVQGVPAGISATFSLGAPEGMPESAIRYALGTLSPGAVAVALDLRIGTAVPPGSYVLELHARTSAGGASAPVTVIVR